MSCTGELAPAVCPILDGSADPTAAPWFTHAGFKEHIRDKDSCIQLVGVDPM